MKKPYIWIFVSLISQLLSIRSLKFLCLPHMIYPQLCGVDTRILKILLLKAEIWTKQKFKTNVFICTPFTYRTVPLNKLILIQIFNNRAIIIFAFSFMEVFKTSEGQVHMILENPSPSPPTSNFFGLLCVHFLHYLQYSSHIKQFFTKWMANSNFAYLRLSL